MVASCSVVGCKSKFDKTIKRGFFGFPLHDPERLALWIKGTGRPAPWVPSKHTKICSDHFDEKYIKFNNNVCLFDCAVPREFGTGKTPCRVASDDESCTKLKNEESSSHPNDQISFPNVSKYLSIEINEGFVGKNTDHCVDLLEGTDEKLLEPEINIKIEQAESPLENSDALEYLPQENLEEAKYLLFETPSFQAALPSSQILNISSRPRGKKVVYPAQCKPEHDDTPEDVREKLEVAFNALQSLQRKYKALCERHRRLGKKYTKLKSLHKNCNLHRDV